MKLKLGIETISDELRKHIDMYEINSLNFASDLVMALEKDGLKIVDTYHASDKPSEYFKFNWLSPILAGITTAFLLRFVLL